MVVPENWHASHKEGQLSVDILESDNHIIAISTMAGAMTSHIEIFIHNDLLTIRGKRMFPIEESIIKRYFHEECFWGPFSRTIVLPIHVDGARARATYKNGILTVLIPKKYTNASPVPILIVED
jgi:HSP20 family protein